MNHMRRPILISLALVSLLILLFILRGQDRDLETASAPLEQSKVEQSMSATLPAQATAPAPEDETPTAPEPAREVVVAQEAPVPESPVAQCVVTGTVVDESGAPLAEVPVQVSAYQVWTEGVDVPRLEGPYDMRGFEVVTEADGAFRIEAPVPTAPRTVLKIRPDRFHDSHTLYFDSSRNSAELGLSAGVRDLGEIRLATTGALRGRVVDQAGTPLANANISIGPGRSTTYSRDTTTDAEGRYVVAHAPIGTYAIMARVEGFLSGYIEPVTVERQRDTEVAEFVLEVAPRIEGIVRDELGQPISGVNLHGWPSTSGRGASGKSADDGRFVIYLPQREPYTLGAKRDGFRSWGDEHDKSKLYEPGTQGLEVVMHSTPSTRFTVLDPEGRVIERFGLKILDDNGSKSASRIRTERRRPPLQDHPGGVAEATAREGIDLYVISAEGYLLASGDVEHDQPGSLVQTVRMRPGATLRGRILRDGDPVSGVVVEAVEGWMRGVRSADGVETEAKEFRANENTMRTATTDDAGRFSIAALDSGTHRLIARPQGGAPLIVVPIQLRVPEDRDLGDLYLTEGGAIAGTVLLPPGVDPAGLEVYLDDWKNHETALTDARGRFEFEGLAPGAHTLTLGNRPGVLASSRPVPVELTAGVTTDVTLDARDRLMCAVKLTLDLGEIPVNSIQVDLTTEDGMSHSRLGHCDEKGVVAGSVRAWGPAYVHVWLPRGRAAVHPDVIDLVPSAQIERELKFEFASLALDLPPDVTFPTNGTAQAKLTGRGATRTLRSARMQFVDGKPSGDVAAYDRVEPTRLVFGAFLAGEYELTFSLAHEDAEYAEIPVEGGGMRYEKLPYFSATRNIVLVANEELAVTLN